MKYGILGLLCITWLSCQAHKEVIQEEISSQACSLSGIPLEDELPVEQEENKLPSKQEYVAQPIIKETEFESPDDTINTEDELESPASDEQEGQEIQEQEEMEQAQEAIEEDEESAPENPAQLETPRPALHKLHAKTEQTGIAQPTLQPQTAAPEISAPSSDPVTGSSIPATPTSATSLENQPSAIQPNIMPPAKSAQAVSSVAPTPVSVPEKSGVNPAQTTTPEKAGGQALPGSGIFVDADIPPGRFRKSNRDARRRRWCRDKSSERCELCPKKEVITPVENKTGATQEATPEDKTDRIPRLL